MQTRSLTNIDRQTLESQGICFISMSRSFLSYKFSQAKPKMDIQAELASKLGLQGQISKTGMTEDKDDKSDTQSVTSRKSAADTKSITSTAENAASGSKVKKEGKQRSHSKKSDGGHKKQKANAKHHHHHHKKGQEGNFLIDG